MSVIGKLKGIYRWHIQRHILELLIHPDDSARTERVGGWNIPTSLLKPGAICYCGGVGEDAVLEVSLAKDYQCTTYAYDPTPRAIEHIKKLEPTPEHFHFVPVGLWSSDATLRFYAPETDRFVSHSIVEADTNRTYFDAPCKKISTLMQEYGHAHLDMLKLNIEGAEYEVLDAMIAENIFPTSIVLTFEGAGAFRKVFRWRRRLQSLGYHLVAFRLWAATFVRDSSSTPRTKT